MISKQVIFTPFLQLPLDKTFGFRQKHRLVSICLAYLDFTPCCTCADSSFVQRLSMISGLPTKITFMLLIFMLYFYRSLLTKILILNIYFTYLNFATYFTLANLIFFIVVVSGCSFMYY